MATILIVEDNAANMKLAVFLLQNAGYTVLSAPDAETGLTLARGAHPDLIPVGGVFGGTMGFYDRDGIVLLPGGYVYAPADDGHILAHTVLRYEVKPGGKIEWKLLDGHAGE